MLPGFRFLLAAIILSTSMLVFGLGAAALLRAAHEQFASNPSWHSAPEATFAQQQAEPAPPVLAMLHADPAPVELKAPDTVSALNTPAMAPTVEQATNVATPAEQTAVSPKAPEQASVTQASITPASEPERVAVLKPEQTSAPESATAAKPAVPAEPAASLSAPVKNETSSAEASGSTSLPSPSDGTVAPTKQASIAPLMPQANESLANATATEATSTETNAAEHTNSADSRADPAVPLEVDAISTKLAALDGRPLIVQPRPRPAAAIARAEQAAKKRLALQAALRRKRALQAQQAALFPPLFPPFPQQLNQPPGVATNH
ncbi:MAG TPA: hypothetical protein VJV58_18995 [Bradyrhizobium sp.]|uniref:hypothetical protein n=1 Tax=Bradyrhizobium sp. TaxID=376 RepID=UPI002B475463|nr:hypothetical protein [Bradyrhizobium sp.]HKO73021.1 hypothetical protein [Bradyrhizobium sp.]